MSRGSSFGEKTLHDERHGIGRVEPLHSAAASARGVSPRPSNGGASASGSRRTEDRPPHGGSGHEAADGEPIDPLTRGLGYLGLTAHEAQMYRTVLKMGPLTARQAIQSSRLDRATGYRILARLAARGLVASAGHRPQRFLALDITRLLDRITLLLRDEVDLQRVVRGLYLADSPPARIPGETSVTSTAALSPAPARPAPSLAQFRFLPDDAEVSKYLSASLDRATDSFEALMRPQLIPEEVRDSVARAIARALTRGVRARLVLDYRPPDLEFVSRVLAQAGTGASLLEVRIWTPQLARLWIFDAKTAARAVSALGISRSPSGPALASEEEEFVRGQVARFQSIWREATPLEAPRSPAVSTGAMGAVSPRDLRRRSERLTPSFSRGGTPFDDSGDPTMSRMFRV